METRIWVLYLQSYVLELFHFYSLIVNFKVAQVLIPLYLAKNYNLFIFHYSTGLFKLSVKELKIFLRLSIKT